MLSRHPGHDLPDSPQFQLVGHLGRGQEVVVEVVGAERFRQLAEVELQERGDAVNVGLASLMTFCKIKNQHNIKLIFFECFSLVRFSD